MDVSEYRRRYAEELEQATRQQTTFRDALRRSRPPGAGGAARRARLQGAAREGTERQQEERQEVAREGAAREEEARQEADAVAGALVGDDADASVALAVLRDGREAIGLRIRALDALSTTLATRGDAIDAALDLLRDAGEPPELRKAALSALQQASFRAIVFAPKRPAYFATLRALVDDRDADLRRRVIGVLARENDEYVQRRLIEGLEQPSAALVPAAKAIQFLGYDIHAEHFPLLRRIAQRPPSRAAQKEAIRLLGSDPASGDLLAGILADKRHPPDVRRASAVALQSLDPSRFEAQARRIARDDGEDEGLRASCITALTQFANPATLSADHALTRTVAALQGRSASRQVKQATAGYMAKVGR